MDRMLFIGMSGAKETLLSQGLNINNLANVSTTGFRADLAQARSMPVFGPGLPTRAYAMTERYRTNFEAGPLNTTGRDLDVAIKGEGWLTVQGRDGTEAYSRAGDFHITANGQLVTGTGLPVIGNGGPIAIPPAEGVSIGVDGTITIKPVGQGAEALVVVDRIKLVNPPTQDLEKGEDGLVRLKDGTVAAADASVQVISGALEGSNVSPALALTTMISNQRHYEMQIKVMKIAKENDERAAQLLRMS